MVGFADPDAVDGSGQIWTHMPFQQFATLVQTCRYCNTKPAVTARSERIVQGAAGTPVADAIDAAQSAAAWAIGRPGGHEAMPRQALSAGKHLHD
jgi:hypothetical protein